MGLRCARAVWLLLIRNSGVSKQQALVRMLASVPSVGPLSMALSMYPCTVAEGKHNGYLQHTHRDT
eukprot:scaffold70309_cov32-Tisochrysis_lutea.AAC.4